MRLAGHCGISRRGGVDEIDWDLVLMEYLLRRDESSVHNIPGIQTPGETKQEIWKPISINNGPIAQQSERQSIFYFQEESGGWIEQCIN